MATLSDLHQSISIMGLVDQINLIKKTRLSRRTPKYNRKAKKTTKRKSPIMKKSLTEIAAMLSPKQLAQLRAELLGARS